MRWRAGLLAGLASAGLGCAVQRAGDVPRVQYGTDVCVRCGMVVSEERFAAGYVDARGVSVVFDDLAEFLATVADHPDLIPNAHVHEAETGRWMRAGTACYVRVPGLPTPMGSGIAAFAGAAASEAFARRLGATPVALRLGERVPAVAVAMAPAATSPPGPGR